MTQDEIIAAAWQAGVWIPLGRGEERDRAIASLAKFAEVVAAAEREECAKLCESKHTNGSRKYTHADECAEAIRTR